jgi:hypothetical protein
MAKIILSMLLTLSLFAGNDFETQCLNCHRSESAPDMYEVYLIYLKKYGSDEQTGDAMFDFLKNPQVENSRMKMEVISRYGLHPSLPLKDQQLRRLIEAYIEQYNIKKHITITR